MDRKSKKSKPHALGKSEKGYANPSAETIESWLHKLPPSLLDNKGVSRHVSETENTLTATISTATETGSIITKTDDGAPKIPKEKHSKHTKEKHLKNNKEKHSKHSKERHHEHKKRNHSDEEKKEGDEVSGNTVNTEVDHGGHEAQPNKVDKVTLHRKLMEYKESVDTLYSVRRGVHSHDITSKMSPNMQNYLADQRAKNSIMLDSNHPGWRKSWDKFLPNYLAEKDKKDEKIDMVSPKPTEDPVDPIDPDVIDQPIIKTIRDHLKVDIFGFRSMLNEQKRIICRPYSTSGTEGPDSESRESAGRDMTWICELSPSDVTNKRKTIFRRVGPEGSRNPLYIIWIYLMIGARMPFTFQRHPDPAKGVIFCKFDRHRRFYYAFLAASVFLFLVTVITLTSFLDIFFEEERLDDPFRQIEKLLLDKNFVGGIVFVTTLIMATITSLNVLMNGEAMAAFITDWEESLDELNFDARSGIRLLTIIFIVWSFVQAVGEAILFYYKRLELNPFIEGVHLMIVLVFRYFNTEILLSEYRDFFGAIVIGLNNYALYCARSFILMVMVFSVGMTNIANEWNFRLRLILKHVSTLEHEDSIRDLLQNLNYRKLFDKHQKLVKLVKDTSSVFGVLLLSFYLTQGINLSGQLVEIAVYLTNLQQMKDDPSANFSQGTAQRVNYTYGTDVYNRVDVAFHLSQTVAIVGIVSVYLAATGEAMMDALYLITRHNHMNTKSTHQRNFLMSLIMSFNPGQPYLLGTGGLFYIDKSFMYSFFAGGMYFLSVMMQTRIPRLLTVPIVFECQNGSGTLCVRHVGVPPGEEIYRNPMLIPILPARRPFTSTMKSDGFPCLRPGGVTPESQLFKCKGVEVDRYRVYDKNGTENSSRLNNTFECLYYPYPLHLDVGPSPYYDCFGNHLTKLDACGMLDFGVGTKLPTSISTPLVLSYPDKSSRNIICHDLDKTFYISTRNISKAEDRFICGIPHWIARFICLNASIDPQKPRKFTLSVFQSRLSDEMVKNAVSPDTSIRTTCGNANDPTRFNPDGLTLAPLARFWTRTDRLVHLLALEGEAPLSARQYFPYFHPKLLGTHINAALISVCQNPSKKNCVCNSVALNYDDCGGLDFDRIGRTRFTAPGPGTIFKCYRNDTTCTRKRCEEWTTWFNKDRPVF